MTDERTNHESGDERDLLLSRIVDGEAGAADWDRFRDLASDDRAVWAELAKTQGDQGALSDAVRSRIRVADAVDLPTEFADPAPLQHRLDQIGRWGGWAAAAAIVLVWATGQSAGVNGGQQAGLGPSLTSDQAFQRYLDAGKQDGQVVFELPEQVVETRQQDDGTFEVMVLRQVLERRAGYQMVTPTQDEYGNEIDVPLQLNPVGSGAQ